MIAGYLRKTAGGKDETPHKPAAIDAILSKAKLQRKLHQARCICVDNLAECRVVDVAIHRVRTEELSVIKRVERLHAEFQYSGFGEMSLLQPCDVPIVHSQPVKQAPRCIYGRTQRGQAEECGIEVGLTVSGVTVQLQIARRNIQIGESVVIHSVGEASDQRPEK